MKAKIDLTKGSIMKKLLIVAIPTLATSLVQMAYNLTDMFWVGKTESIGLDPNETVAAIGTAGFYPWLGFGLILIAKIGTSVKVSQSAGKNDFEEVKKYANNGLLIMIVLAAMYVSFGYFFGELFIDFFEIENDNIVNYANDYLRIISLFGFSFFLVNIFNGIYDGLGKTINTFYITSVGLVLNMILDPILILHFELGVKGAAIATVISQALILVIYLYIYMSKYRPVQINFKKYISLNRIKAILKIGVPAGVQSMIFTIIVIVIARIVASFDDSRVMATQRLGSQIEAFSWMVASGFQVALASFIGQNFGAQKFDRIREGYFTALKLLIPYGIVVSVLMFIFAEQLFGIFFDDLETIAMGKDYLMIISISQLFMIIEIGTAGAFNGLGKTYVPSIVGIAGNALRIPFAYALIGSMGFIVIWWVISLTAVFKGVILLLWFLILLRAMKKRSNSLLVEKIETL
ncbi:MAG: MATE family efflux transporter [Candidatus Izemoplasma sp.]